MVCLIITCIFNINTKSINVLKKDEAFERVQLQMLNQDSTRTNNVMLPPGNLAAAVGGGDGGGGGGGALEPRVPLRQHQRHPFLQDFDANPSTTTSQQKQSNNKNSKILFEDEDDNQKPSMDRAALEAYGRRVISEAAQKAAAAVTTKPALRNGATTRSIDDVHLLSRDHARLETHRIAAQRVASSQYDVDDDVNDNSE